MQSTMALTATNGTPWVHIDDGQLLLPVGPERVFEAVAEAGRFVPSNLGIPKEHAQQVSCACLPIGSLIRFTSMHDAQVVDELYVALLTIELRTKSFGQFMDDMHGVHLLVRHFRHTGVPLDARASEQRRLDELAHGLTFGKEKGWTGFEVWRLIPVTWLVQFQNTCIVCDPYFCFSSNGQSASAMVSNTSGSVRSSSL